MDARKRIEHIRQCLANMRLSMAHEVAGARAIEADLGLLESILDNLLAGDGWIPVEERQPPLHEDVLIVAHYDGPGVDVGFRTRHGWMYSDTSEQSAEVSHWRPLPGLPAGVE